MNRCPVSAPERTPRANWRKALALLACVCACQQFVPMANAQNAPPQPVRTFPVQARRATLVVTQSPQILINSAPDRLSPGARIHDTNNLLVLPGSLTGQQLLVNYIREPNGMVQEVWILNQAEAAQRLPATLPQ